MPRDTQFTHELAGYGFNHMFRAPMPLGAYHWHGESLINSMLPEVHEWLHENIGPEKDAWRSVDATVAQARSSSVRTGRGVGFMIPLRSRSGEIRLLEPKLYVLLGFKTKEDATLARVRWG